MEDTPTLNNEVVFATCERHLHPDSIAWAPGKLWPRWIFMSCVDIRWKMQSSGKSSWMISKQWNQGGSMRNFFHTSFRKAACPQSSTLCWKVELSGPSDRYRSIITWARVYRDADINHSCIYFWIWLWNRDKKVLCKNTGVCFLK